MPQSESDGERPDSRSPSRPSSPRRKHSSPQSPEARLNGRNRSEDDAHARASPSTSPNPRRGRRGDDDSDNKGGSPVRGKAHRSVSHSPGKEKHCPSPGRRPSESHPRRKSRSPGRGRSPGRRDRRRDSRDRERSRERRRQQSPDDPDKVEVSESVRTLFRDAIIEMLEVGKRLPTNISVINDTMRKLDRSFHVKNVPGCKFFRTLCQVFEKEGLLEMSTARHGVMIERSKLERDVKVRRPISPRRRSPIRRSPPLRYRSRSPIRRDYGRRLSPPPRRYSPPLRRHSPPLRRHSPPPRRYSPGPPRFSPPPRGYSPPPRRYSPPPRRYSPRRRSPPRGDERWTMGDGGSVPDRWEMGR